MKLVFDNSKSLLLVESRIITAWSHVRNELNHLRKEDEIVYTEPVEHPYYPRPFPKGLWTVGTPKAHTALDSSGKPKEPYLYPFFIPTDAWQHVSIWNVKDGKYTTRTGDMYKDSGYGLHFSTSSTTLGCIRIRDESDLRWLVEKIIDAHAKKEVVTLEVL